MIYGNSANVVAVGRGFGGPGATLYLRMMLGDRANISLVHEEARQGSQERAANGHQVVASDAFADALEHFSLQLDRLVRAMPARKSGGGTGLRGPWPVFEKGLVRPCRGR
ncbi:MAG TPA: hypothetical protein VJ827_01885 [Rubrobacter sp.]|nr:hypothetical protein [Rubrobacter sp.]